MILSGSSAAGSRASPLRFPATVPMTPVAVFFCCTLKMGRAEGGFAARAGCFPATFLFFVGGRGAGASSPLDQSSTWSASVCTASAARCEAARVGRDFGFGGGEPALDPALWEEDGRFDMTVWRTTTERRPTGFGMIFTTNTRRRVFPENAVSTCNADHDREEGTFRGVRELDCAQRFSVILRARARTELRCDFKSVLRNARCNSGNLRSEHVTVP